MFFQFYKWYQIVQGITLHLLDFCTLLSCNSSLKSHRSSCQYYSLILRCSFKKSVLKHFAVSKSIFNTFSGLQACSFIKKSLQHLCFPVNIAKFLRTTILKNICKQLLLKSEQIKNKLKKAGVL